VSVAPPPAARRPRLRASPLPALDTECAMTQSVLDVPRLAVPVPDLFAPIAADLEEVERILARELKSRYPSANAVIEHVRHYRGKRLRPVLVLLSARACGRLTSAHPLLGAVVEMIHTATLVHDDILDAAVLRRHVPTVNSRWGTQAGVLLGDHLFTHAFHLASTLDDVRACRLIGQATNRVCEGELCQELAQGNLELTEDEYLDLIDGKTAELTACCCQLGAIYSGASADVVNSLARYGRWLGLAFQIVDDVLDLVGEEKTTGKSLGTDLEQGKMTLPLIHLLAHADPARVPHLKSLLTADGINRREALRPHLEETGSLTYARRRAEELALRAHADLACLPPSACRGILEVLCERVVQRTH
jgi:octaprenyl-diphosphate synthase